MTLLPNWWNILKKAWSVKFMALAAFFAGLEVALPTIDQIMSLPERTFAGLSAFTTGLALITRFLAQKNMEAEDDADQAE